MMNLKVILFVGGFLAIGAENPSTIEIEGPVNNLFIGDFELYICSAPIDQQFDGFKWKHGFSNGKVQPLLPTDITEDKISVEHGLNTRRTFIRIIRGLQSIHCVGLINNTETTHEASQSIELQEFTPVQVLADSVCEESPKIIIKRWGQSMSSHYWVSSHYVTDKQIDISSQVSGVKLTCLFTTSLFAKHPIKWFTTENLTGFRYWTSKVTNHGGLDCYAANLVLSPLGSTSGQKFICGEDKSDSNSKWAEINLRTRDGNSGFDFNKTEECIEHLGTTVFGNSALTWSTTGTSLLSVGMMIGIVFLKKQLDKQKEINNQAVPPPAASTTA